MKIYTLTDPNYFKFCFALCKSIRLNGNDHEIIVDLMDFDDNQKKQAIYLITNKIGGKFRFFDTFLLRIMIFGDFTGIGFCLT